MLGHEKAVTRLSVLDGVDMGLLLAMDHPPQAGQAQERAAAAAGLIVITQQTERQVGLVLPDIVL